MAGDYANYLSGEILPGATKYGMVEYSVEKDVAGQEFYIDSTCGGGPPARFAGTISLP